MTGKNGDSTEGESVVEGNAKGQVRGRGRDDLAVISDVLIFELFHGS